MADIIGEQLGNYRVLRLIGEGGFARVYLGEHIYLKTQAALKVPKIRLPQEDLDTFLVEARTSVSLEHPHIVRVLECGLQDGAIPYLVMTYAPGGTLRRRYPKGTRLPPAAIFLYVRQVASALQYIHHKGLIHQDIKPENMLLGPNEEIMLSDFGIAAVAHRTITMSVQEVTGTARYMAPEQFRGLVRPASDQYALGVVVYEWICGSSPFNGSFAELYSQHLFVAPPSLREKVPDISPAVEQVIMKALAKEPGQRFARVQDFAEALEQARQAPQTFYPATPPPFGSYIQQNEESTPTIQSSQVPSMPRPAAPTPPPPGAFTQENEEEIPTLLSSKMSAVQGRVAPGDKRRGLSRRMVVLLIGLVIVVVAGSLGLIFSGLFNGKHTSGARTGTVLSTPSPPPLYSPMFGFNLQHTRYNPSETILKPGNVSQLATYWTMPTSSSIFSSPLVANGVVYIVSSDNELYAFDAITGKMRWKASMGNVTGIGSFIYSSPAVVNNVVYIGSTDHNLYTFDATTGSKLWTTPTGGAIYASPAVVNNVVYIASDDHNLYAIDATTGHIMWTARASYNINSSPAVVDGVVYVGSDDGKLYAFAASGCEQSPCLPLWIAPTGDYIFSSPAVANGIVYIGSHDNKLYAFDISTCANGACLPLWTAKAADGIESSPTVANGVVYVGSDDGKLYAFAASGCGQPSCSPLWTYKTGDRITSSPTVFNGVVYIGSTDHTLYAFHLPGVA